MKILYAALLFIAPTVVVAEPANSNQFSAMPHYKIMELNIEACETEENATGDANYGKECIYYQKKAFEMLQVIYEKYKVIGPSWSLCLSEAKNGYTYDYVVMLACMKVVKGVCKEKPDGQWDNPRQCVNSMESGLWINNPKIYEPLEQVFKEN